MNENQQKVYEIYQMCTPSPKELLENSKRYFIKEGPVILWNERELKKKDRWFFMFNDVLLIAKRLNGSKLKYRLRVYITLRAQVKVVDVADSHDPCEFRIMAPTKTFVLFGRNKEEKRNWIRWINNVINGKPYNDGATDETKTKNTPTKTTRSTNNRDLHELEEDTTATTATRTPTKAAAKTGKAKQSDDEANGADDDDDDEEEAFNQASEDDEEDDKVITDNPDIQSFVPVLPEQFFTPSGAKLGIRAGSERSAASGGGAAASRRKGTGQFAPAVQSSATTPTAAVATAMTAAASAPTPTVGAAASNNLIDLFDPFAPKVTASNAPPTAAALFGSPSAASAAPPATKPKQDLLSFDDIAPRTPSQANPFGMPMQQQQQQYLFNTSPFGAPAYGYAAHQPNYFQQQQQPQQQQKNPFF